MGKAINNFYRFTLIVICYVCINVIYAGKIDPTLHFSHLTTEDGLIQNGVRAILQDSTGFMWFGTSGGLSRYDGYDFVNYKHDPDNVNSLSNNVISTLFESSNDYLWIGTVGGGLNCFDKQSGTFSHFLHQEDNPNSLGSYSNNISAIAEDNQGYLWIGTPSGLDRYDLEQKVFTHFRYQKDNPHSLSNNDVRAIAYDKKTNNLWIATNSGLNRLDLAQDTSNPENVSFKHYYHDPKDKHTLSTDFITTVFIDNSGTLWAGSFSGLDKFSADTETFTRYANFDLYALTSDQLGQLWFNDDDRLHSFDPKTEKFSAYPSNSTSYSPSSSTILALYQDKSGTIWVGRQKEGLDFFDSNKPKFNHYQIIDNVAGGQINQIKSMAIYDDNNSKTIWTTTFASKLVNYNFASEEYRVFNSFDRAPACHEALAVTDKGIIWCGDGRGLHSYNSAEKQLTSFFPKKNDTNSLLNRNIHYIYAVDDKSLWIGGEGGLSQLDLSTNQFKHYLYDASNPQESAPQHTVFIYADNDNNLWLGSWYNGLKRFDLTTEKFTTFLSEVNNPNSLSDISVHTIQQDKTGIVWIGTNAGLNRFNPQNQTFKHYFVEDGLPSDNIAGILEDNLGDLWISTGNGISKFNPQKESFHNYTFVDGLQGTGFEPGVFAKSKDGQMFFGGTNGFNSFWPEQVANSTYKPPVLITNFRLFNKEVPFGQGVLAKPIWTTKHLNLPYQAKIISFEFAALSYIAPKKNRYRYRLDGLETDWNEIASDQRIATYTSLSPGNYSFLVQGSNPDGVWNKEATKLSLTIIPPWWLTWWFKIFVALSAVITIVVIFRLRFISLRRRNKFLETEVAAKTLVWQEAAVQADIANKAKGDFLAHMSHEFRTPLNAILGYSQLLIKDKSLQPQLLDYALTIDRSGKHLLNLINNVLEFSKIEAGKVSINEDVTDLIRLLDNITSMFFFRAKNKNLQFTMLKDMAIPRFVVTDESKLRQVLINLTNNAIKFTQYGSVTIQSKLKLKEGDILTLEFAISDTGVGINQNDIDNLFEAFEQTGAGKRQKEGTGLGLSIVNEYVDLLGGGICVESEVNQGSTFTFTIKVRESTVQEVPVTEDLPCIIGLAPQQSAYKLLIVEDKLENRQLLKDILSPLGFIVREAIDGQDALEKLKSYRPHLILMDMKMPRMNGYETTQKIRNNPEFADIFILAVTANAFAEDRAKALVAGCNDFISKPFNDQELLIIIGNLLGVKYIYAEKDPTGDSKETTLVSASNTDKVELLLPPEQLSKLLAAFPSWFEELEQAVLTLDPEKIKSLADKLQEHNSDLRDKLVLYVEQFDYQSLNKFISKTRDNYE